MAPAPEQFSLKVIFEAGVAFMGVMSGSLKEIAPPEVPKIWVTIGTLTASAAFFSAKLLASVNNFPPSRETWFDCSMFIVWVAVICGIVYILTRLDRTIQWEGETKLAGTVAEIRQDVAEDPQNDGKTPEALLFDAAGVVGDIWPKEALNRSRRILGTEYALFIALLSLGLCLGIEAYNTPKPDPDFADQVAKLRDVHFVLDKTDLGPDAADLLHADAGILKDAFKQFSRATVNLEGYCDDVGTDAYNFALAWKRAEAVKQALVADGIDSKKMTISSHGKMESPCQKGDEACREKNRRVHLLAIQN
jgi:outer membrane protein OmpA-like peptidoglycan-associated protein